MEISLSCKLQTLYTYWQFCIIRLKQKFLINYIFCDFNTLNEDFTLRTNLILDRFFSLNHLSVFWLNLSINFFMFKTNLQSKLPKFLLAMLPMVDLLKLKVMEPTPHVLRSNQSPSDELYHLPNIQSNLPNIPPSKMILKIYL